VNMVVRPAVGPVCSAGVDEPDSSSRRVVAGVDVVGTKACFAALMFVGPKPPVA